MSIRYPCGCYATLQAAHVLGVVYCPKHTWAMPMRRRLPTLDELAQALGAGQVTLPFEPVGG